MFDSIMMVLEIMGVIAFAIAGSIVAIDKEMDMVGVVFLAMITSFGGGIMRDLVMGRTPLFFTSLGLYISVALVTSLAVFVFAHIFKKWYVKNERSILFYNNFVDAIGISAFSVSGVKMCLEFFPEPNPFLAIMIGMLSAIGGGMVRDVCLRDIPFVFRKHIYALATLAGATVYYVLRVHVFEEGVTGDVISLVIGMLSVFTIRVLATVFHWNMPKAINFSKMYAEAAAENADNGENNIK